MATWEATVTNDSGELLWRVVNLANSDVARFCVEVVLRDRAGAALLDAGAFDPETVGDHMAEYEALREALDDWLSADKPCDITVGALTFAIKEAE